MVYAGLLKLVSLARASSEFSLGSTLDQNLEKKIFNPFFKVNFMPCKQTFSELECWNETNLRAQWKRRILRSNGFFRTFWLDVSFFVLHVDQVGEWNLALSSPLSRAKLSFCAAMAATWRAFHSTIKILPHCDLLFWKMYKHTRRANAYTIWASQDQTQSHGAL